MLVIPFAFSHLSFVPIFVFIHVQIDSCLSQMKCKPCARCMQSLTPVSIYSVNVSCEESDCQVVWEMKPTPEEEQKARNLQLPPTFFCGLGTSDSNTDDKSDFETELLKAKQELVTDRRIKSKNEPLLNVSTFNHTLYYSSFTLLICKKSTLFIYVYYYKSKLSLFVLFIAPGCPVKQRCCIASAHQRYSSSTHTEGADLRQASCDSE